MTAWHKGPMLAFDVESTGPNPDTARIVSAVLVALVPGSQPHVTEWLVDPGIPIPAGASAIHGITTERARRDGQDPDAAVFEITGRIGRALGKGIPLVGMNICYDLTVLDRECRRHKIDTLDRRLDAVEPVIDIFVLDKHVSYRKGKRTLTALSEHYHVPLTQAHNAAADAVAAARVAYALAEQYEGLQIAPKSLHDLEVGWRRAQCESLAAYFVKQGKPQEVNGDWPVQALPTGWTPTQVDEVEEEAAS